MACDIGRFVPRWILSTFNFIIILVTCILLILSVLMVTVPSHTLDLLLYVVTRPGLEVPGETQESLATNLSPSLVSGLGWVSLFTSLLLLLPALTGYVGSVRESRFCLILYLSPLILVWSSQLTFLILLPIVKNQFYTILSSLARLSLNLYTEKQEVNVVSFLWNLVMVHLQCCGVSSHQDFQETEVWSAERDKKQILPAVCCILETHQYPLSRITPVDTHCTSVPTKYNSFWMQKYRNDKNCHRIIVSKPRHQDRKECLREERKNLIYTEAVSDGVP